MKALTKSSMASSLKNFLQDDEAATAAEYGILAALVAVAIIAAVTAFGTKLSTMFTGLGNTVQGVKTTT